MYFDCDTRIGRSFGTKNLGGYDISPENLLGHMDRIGIEKALVFHTMAWEYHPNVGNAMLMEALAPHRERLEPCWVMLPHHTGEVPHPEESVAEMQRLGVKAARIFPNFPPNSHRFELAEWCIGEMLDALEAARIPLLLDFVLFRREQPPFRDIFSICENHPDLPVILIGVQARNNRSLYPLLKRFPNLHVQTAGYFVHRGLEHFGEFFGSRQLVFGSNTPTLGMGAAHFHVERAMVSESDRAAIAGGNLSALLDVAAERAKQGERN
jgi:hypothetical protein